MYKTVLTAGGVRQYLSQARIIAFDFETAPDEKFRNDDKSALDPHMAHIVGISFSKAEGDAIYLPIAHKVGQNTSPLTEIWDWLAKNFFVNPNIVKVAHNLAFESAFLYARGIILQEPVYDTIAAAQLTLKGRDEFRTLSDSGLKTLVPELLDFEMPSFSDVTAGRHFDELDPSDAKTIDYACSDADYTLRLYHLLNGWFDKWLPGHRFITEYVESPTSVYCGLMKYNGLLVDTERMKKQSEHCETERQRLREEISFIIGEVNLGENASTSAFKKYLFEDLGLPILKTTAKYQEAADDETLMLLAEWCEKNRLELVPLFTLVQEYRRIGKIKSTYIDGYEKYINPVTGHIHADLMPLATETGRFAARRPNLQNMPRAGADEVGVRNFFIVPKGKVLLSLDFSQIELRVGAYYCRDEKMIEIYQTGGDIHDQTATVVFGEGKHNKEQRTIAKNVNFGTFYGLFPRGLQKTLKFKASVDKTLPECEEIISNLKIGYPKLTSWQESTKTKAKSTRYAETALGRRRYLPGISSQDWGKQSFAERCALNTPIQGTAADILKLALGRILKGLPERPWLLPLLQIHDELVFELPKDKVSEAAAFIKQCMEEQPFPDFDVPVVADAAGGARFGEMKELEV